MGIALIISVLVFSALLGYKFNYLILVLEGKEKPKLTMPLKKFHGCIIAFFAFAISITIFCLIDIEKIYLMYIDLILTLVILAVIDIKYKIIPNILLIMTLISQLSILLLAERAVPAILNVVISLAVVGVLSLISRLSGEQIGMGDIKLIGIVNLFYGISFMLYSLIFSMFILLIFSMPGFIMKKIGLKSALPFMPFYVLGTIVYLILNIL